MNDWQLAELISRGAGDHANISLVLQSSNPCLLRMSQALVYYAAEDLQRPCSVNRYFDNHTFEYLLCPKWI